MSVSVSNSVLRASATWLKVEKFNSADPLPPKRGREGVVVESETLSSSLGKCNMSDWKYWEIYSEKCILYPE